MKAIKIRKELWERKLAVAAVFFLAQTALKMCVKAAAAGKMLDPSQGTAISPVQDMEKPGIVRFKKDPNSVSIRIDRMETAEHLREEIQKEAKKGAQNYNTVQIISQDEKDCPYDLMKKIREIGTLYSPKTLILMLPYTEFSNSKTLTFRKTIPKVKEIEFRNVASSKVLELLFKSFIFPGLETVGFFNCELESLAALDKIVFKDSLKHVKVANSFTKSPENGKMPDLLSLKIGTLAVENVKESSEPISTLILSLMLSTADEIVFFDPHTFIALVKGAGEAACKSKIDRKRIFLFDVKAISLLFPLTSNVLEEAKRINVKPCQPLMTAGVVMLSVVDRDYETRKEDVVKRIEEFTALLFAIKTPRVSVFVAKSNKEEGEKCLVKLAKSSSANFEVEIVGLSPAGIEKHLVCPSDSCEKRFSCKKSSAALCTGDACCYCGGQRSR